MLRRGMRDACKYRTAYRKPIRRGMSRFPRFDVRVSSEASALRKEGGPAMPIMPAARSFMGNRRTTRTGQWRKSQTFRRPRPLSFIFLSFGPVLTMISCARAGERRKRTDDEPPNADECETFHSCSSSPLPSVPLLQTCMNFRNWMSLSPRPRRTAE